jgi:hypothetical protein
MIRPIADAMFDQTKKMLTAEQWGEVREKPMEESDYDLN